MSPQRQLRSHAFRLSTNRQGSHITSYKGSVSADTSRINSAVCLVPSVRSSIEFSTATCVLVLVFVYETQTLAASFKRDVLTRDINDIVPTSHKLKRSGLLLAATKEVERPTRATVCVSSIAQHGSLRYYCCCWPLLRPVVVVVVVVVALLLLLLQYQGIGFVQSPR